jgi:ubiquitin C-terminal hydrolase
MYGGGPAIARDQYFPVYQLAIKKHELNLVGMINPQYLCYMISVIQCLLSIQQLSFYFFKR